MKANFKIKTRTLTETIVIDDNVTLDKGTVINAEDVMRITGITSKATALKRMNCADEKVMLAKKGKKAGYEYSKEHAARNSTDSLTQFRSKSQKTKWIIQNRPYYDYWFRKVLKII